MSLFNEKYLSKTDLKSLSTIIAEVEKKTSGEIRVVIRHRRQWRERKLSLHNLTLNEFYRLGMQKTRDKTGVLILLLLSERKFQIIADEGIHKKVEEGKWDKIAGSMTNYFTKGNYFEGIAETIRAVGEELAKYFPRKADDTNELPDEIIQQ